MTTRERITEVLLWAAVVVWGCMLGGIFYETLVVIPAWTAAPPESLSIMTHPRYPIVPGRMWIPFSGLNTLLSIVVLIAAWNQPSRRRWLIFAVGIVVLSHIMQFGFFWPKIYSMIVPGAAPDAVASAARQYVTFNWLRVAYVAAGFLATLRAFRIPSLGIITSDRAVL